MTLNNFIIDANITWDRVSKSIFEKPQAKPGRKLRVQVTNAGVVDNLTGYTLHLGWRNGVNGIEGLDIFTAVDATKGLFELQYTEGMLSNAGSLRASLVLVNIADVTIAESNDFVIRVTPSPFSQDASQSTTSLTSLAEILLNEASREQAAAEQAAAFETYDQRIEQLETGVKHEVTNIITTNSDFATTEGFALFGASVATANNVMTITGTGFSSLPNAGFNLPNIPTGAKVYMRVWARVLNAVCSKISIRSESTEIASKVNPIENQWYEIAAVRTKTGALETALNMAMTHTYADSATANGKQMEVKWAVAIQLTEDFGAGMEPTADYTTFMLNIYDNKYFSGTATVYPVQSVAENLASVEQRIDDRFDEFVESNIVPETVTQKMLDFESASGGRLVSVEQQLEQAATDITVAKSVGDKTLRPTTLAYDYEKSPARLYPNFLNRLRTGDLTNLKVVFVGDSHTAGQGATETGGEKVPQLPPPAGVTDGFHKRDNSSGVFVDKIARQMEKAYGLSITRRIVAASEVTYYNLRTGTWAAASDTRMTTASGAPNTQSSSTIGDSLIKQFDPAAQQRCATIHFARLPSGGILNVEIKTNNVAGLSGLTRNDASVWKKPSELSGVIRSDGATGTAMDTVDLYNATGDYAYALGFTFPFFANWQIRFTVSATKNALSTGNLCVLGTTVLEHENFVNAGRGNHTTLDYLGNTVTKGAGGSGDLDHTDHLAEVLAYNPSLIILEPMIINDWFHGANLQDTTTCIQEMIQRIKKANCDIVIITPAPCVTDLVVLDYAAHPDYLTSPPLVNNLNGMGSYEKYIDAILKVAYWEQVPVINNYKYFLERFYKTDHQNWTLGTGAGRIHVNQYGHDIYTEGVLKFSGLFPATINAL